MVALAPFRALRYNPDRIGTLGPVLAPPYDVISPDEQEQLYQASPYNVVRLIYGQELPDDDERHNRYTRAKDAWARWRADGVLIREAQPAVYLCEQAFVWEGRPAKRLGVIALLDFEGSAGQVLRHEATFQGPKTDRAHLLEAVRANLSPVFCIAPDPQRRLHQCLEQITAQQPPLATARFRGDEVRLWAVTDPGAIGRIAGRLAGVRMLIADGHHRFEVALAHRHLSASVMTYVALREDPALVVRPIHRVLRAAPQQREQWRRQLEALCRLEPRASAEELMRWLSAAPGHGCFGYYDAGGFSAVSLREAVVAEWLLRPSVPPALAGLDVTILHQALLPRLPGANGQGCWYTPDHEQAIERARQYGPDGCAWLLRPIPLAQVFAVAGEGLALPQKSTFFYPKVLSGLVFNPFDDG
ncbi:MAG: DUF1015 domain-containing protein [Candidatus Omnitrophica bacterium]|nr:DUF1015 domain-containing protein [Candidatus Omnitrophota bacterium]